MKLKANTPHHGLGEHGKAHRMGGLMAGAHMPQKVTATGISSGTERRNGKQSGSLKTDGTSDTRVRKGPEGNSKGSPPPGVAKTLGASLSNHKGTDGRGGRGKIGQGDSFKGRDSKMTESISHSAFEKLGAD